MDLCLQRYKDIPTFINSFSINQFDYYINQGRDQMVLTKNVPTLNIARITFGEETVKSLLQTYLTRLAISEGVTTTPESCLYIAEDILSGYGDLKITEIILAFKLISEGKIRESNGDLNRGRFYGTLSSGTICDCLYQFRFKHRNEIIDRHEKELQEERKKYQQEHEDELYESGLQQLYELILSLHWYDVSKVYNEAICFIKPKDMPTLDFYARERKALDRLRELCEGLLMSIDKHNEEHPGNPVPELPEIEGIRKGVKYINEKFPYSIIEIAQSAAESLSK